MLAFRVPDLIGSGDLAPKEDQLQNLQGFLFQNYLEFQDSDSRVLNQAWAVAPVAVAPRGAGHVPQPSPAGASGNKASLPA